MDHHRGLNFWGNRGRSFFSASHWGGNRCDYTVEEVADLIYSFLGSFSITTSFKPVGNNFSGVNCHNLVVWPV